MLTVELVKSYDETCLPFAEGLFHIESLDGQDRQVAAEVRIWL